MISKVSSFFLLFLLLIFTCCGPKSGKNGTLASKIKFTQYYINGKRLYIEHCSNCHQKDGSGLASLYPPIHNSGYFKSGPDSTICIIRNGIEGKIIVNGISYNQPMPGHKDLTVLEIAELVTYLYSTWGEEDKIFSTVEVYQILENCFLNL